MDATWAEFGRHANGGGADGYDWQFIPEAGKTFVDLGSGKCH